MQRVVFLLLFLSTLLFQAGAALAETCLDDVASFAIRICGEISNSGTSTTIDAAGNLDANVANIIKRIVGGASAKINGHVLYDAYAGVAREQLAATQFNSLDCRQKMVSIAVKEICRSPSRSRSNTEGYPTQNTQGACSPAIAGAGSVNIHCN